VTRDLRAYLFLVVMACAAAGECAPAAVAPGALPAAVGAAGKVVWLDFWASWCTPCRHSFPWMNAMQHKYGKDGFTIVAVNLDQDRAAADAFLAATPAQFTLQFDPAGALARQFDVEAMPSSYLLDRTGRIVVRHLGFKESKEPEYEAAIRAALTLQSE
jgi:thiol-disulfide isomerase/thioredoxin